MRDKKRPDILWDAVSELLTLVSFLSSSLRPEYFKVKRIGQTHQWSGPGNQRSYWAHFHLGFNQGCHFRKIGTQGWNLCGTESSSYWNDLHFWFVELMLSVCRSIGSNHRRNLILTYVPYYCSSPPWIGGAFSSISLAHPQLVHISENMLSKETPVYICHFAVFLPVIHQSMILQYLCLFLL